MIDPIIFSFELFNIQIALRWYGVLVMAGVIAGAWFAEKEIRRRGENGESIWDAMIWVLPIGILGARLWYVINSLLGGSTYYLEAPIKVLYIWEGGLHFFGGLLLGALALYLFLKRNGMDPWLFLDAIAPATLLGQALARPANFINQELYGQPTELPWGIPIEALHRLPQYADLNLFPVVSTRFHPTFAYEMILNVLIVLFLWWISRRYEEDLKPGAVFSAWLLLAGLSRTFIEFFRPDQPKIGDSFVSYTMLVSFAMAVAGLVLLLVRFGKLQPALAKGWATKYRVKKQGGRARARSTAAESVLIDERISGKRSAKAAPRHAARRKPSSAGKKRPTARRKPDASNR
jgi:phosphatidylglycerol:prolipoprotein diacylglycerol transferase